MEPACGGVGAQGSSLGGGARAEAVRRLREASAAALAEVAARWRQLNIPVPWFVREYADAVRDVVRLATDYWRKEWEEAQVFIAMVRRVSYKVYSQASEVRELGLAFGGAACQREGCARAGASRERSRWWRGGERCVALCTAHAHLKRWAGV